MVAQMVKNLPAVQETWVQSLSWEDPLEKEMETHSSTLAWKIPWMEEPGRLQSMALQRVRHDFTFAFSNKQTCPIFNFSLMMSCIHSFNEKFLHLKIELQQCSPYSLCRDCDVLKNKSF